MKNILTILILLCLSGVRLFAQTISVAAARALPAGSIVTVSGTVTSGSEFGTIRYMQDATGGIALYSTTLSGVVRGDNVTVTGTTTQFQNLLEVGTVTASAVNSSGNPSPVSQMVTPLQLSEPVESRLVKVNNAAFATAGVFAGNTSYTINAGGESGIVYVRSTNPLVGQPIPTGNVNITGICTQFGAQYQLLPRDLNDFVASTTIAIIGQPQPSNISTTGLNVSWQTNMPGNAFVKYGHTPALELGTLTGPVSTSSPTINISGGSPSQLYYTQCYSVNGSDTAFSGVDVHITASTSSGTIRAYFDQPVDNQVAIPAGNNAIYLNNAFADTIKAYIDRSISTLDVAIYSFDDAGATQIAQAINDAKARGVRVRVIVESGNANNGLTLLNPAIPVLQSPGSSLYYGIMHNKFMVIDVNHADPNRPMVMSGSTNWTQQQLQDDRNNLVFIQDRSLAIAYTMEFEEMWGGSAAQPDTLNDKFGPDKTDNTPHLFNVAGKTVESFFSPSDNTNEQIIRSINTADNEAYFATMVYTRTDLATAFADRVMNFGIYGAGIMNDSAGGSGPSFLIIQNAVGVARELLFDHASQPGILHHKYLIVDPNYSTADPLVLTGSHNWSSSATQKNDENTLIIHDALIANQYYQEFHNLFNTNGGALGLPVASMVVDAFQVYPNPSEGTFTLSFNAVDSGSEHVLISDLCGKIITRQVIQTVPGKNEFQIISRAVASGTYLIRLERNGAVSRLVIR